MKSSAKLNPPADAISIGSSIKKDAKDQPQLLLPQKYPQMAIQPNLTQWLQNQGNIGAGNHHLSPTVMNLQDNLSTNPQNHPSNRGISFTQSHSQVVVPSGGPYVGWMPPKPNMYAWGTTKTPYEPRLRQISEVPNYPDHNTSLPTLYCQERKSTTILRSLTSSGHDVETHEGSSFHSWRTLSNKSSMTGAPEAINLARYIHLSILTSFSPHLAMASFPQPEIMLRNLYAVIEVKQLACTRGHGRSSAWEVL